MSELNIFVLIVRENMLISRGIYTTGKKFTLPPAVTALTNSTSVPPLANHAPNPEIENRCGGILNIDAAALSNCMVNASQEEDIQGNTLYINIKFKIIYHFYQISLTFSGSPIFSFLSRDFCGNKDECSIGSNIHLRMNVASI